MGSFSTILAILIYLLSFFGLIPKNQGGTPPSVGMNDPSFPRRAEMEIMAFYAERYRNDPVPRRSMATAAPYLTTIFIFGPAITADGRLVGELDRALIAAARQHGLKVLATVHNAVGGRFDRQTVHNLLHDPMARTRAVEAIQGLLATYMLDGVCLDLENVPPEDRDALVAFFREVSLRLRPRHYLVAACLPAKTNHDPQAAWTGAYDYLSLAPYLDLAVVMAYDQHRPDGPAGPVAASFWVEEVIRYTVSIFPRQNVLLGIPAYGYEWGPKSGRALTYTGAVSLLNKYGLTPQWDGLAQVPYFRYTRAGKNYTVWYEDRRSGAAKAALARRYGLRGVAVWRLGYEDPGLWQSLAGI